MKIQWLGHSAFKIVSDQGVNIYIDPWIKDNPVCPITLEEAKDADIVCVTHGHEDHLGDAIEIVKKSGAKLICSPEIGNYATLHGIPYDEGSIPINIGGCTTHKGITIHATPSVHVSALYGEEWFKNKVMLPNGSSMGFVIVTEDGHRVFHAGDTGLTYDLKLVGEIYNPDVALLPIGGRYTMTPELAARAAAWVGAPRVIPMHYNTFPSNQQDPQRYLELINNLTSGIDVVVLKPGEMLTV